MAQDPYKYFRIEARELIEAITQATLELQKNAADRDALARLLRLLHTLKGASRVVKLRTIAEAVHAMEDMASPYRTNDDPVLPTWMQMYLSSRVRPTPM